MLTKVTDKLEKVLLAISCSLIATSVIVMCLEVYWRKVVGGSLGWAEEYCRFGYVYALFLLSGPIFKRGMHIKVEVVYARLNANARKWAAIGICSLAIMLPTFFSWWAIESLTETH